MHDRHLFIVNHSAITEKEEPVATVLFNIYLPGSAGSADGQGIGAIGHRKPLDPCGVDPGLAAKINGLNRYWRELAPAVAGAWLRSSPPGRSLDTRPSSGTSHEADWLALIAKELLDDRLPESEVSARMVFLVSDHDPYRLCGGVF